MKQKLKKLYLNAGQMKAGTTYLYSVLRPHRKIFFSPEKEIHYLSQMYGPFHILNDNVRMRKARSMLEIASKMDRPIGRYQEVVQWAADYLRPPGTEGWYEDMFKGHRSDQWVADFSNLTCTISVDGLKEVSQIADDVRVTYCIRNAIPRAFSHAKFHLRFAGQAHELSTLPPQELRQLLLSDNIYPQSRSEDHIAALHQVFGNERLRIIRCESLWSDPRQVVDKVCSFLDLESLPGEIKREAVNVGPKTEKTEEVARVFEEIFGELQNRQDELLERHRDILIA